MQRVTEHLVLRAATYDLAKAELSSLDTFGALLGVTVPRGWPPGEYDRGAQEFFLDCLREGGERLVGWYSWYAIYRDGQSRTLVAAGGFLGPPDQSGFVEIGFSVHPAWQRRGIASEMARELVAFAFEDKRVRGVVGNTSPDNIASCRVLSRLGFVREPLGRDQETTRFVLMKQLS